jgi:hypothetical protein
MSDEYWEMVKRERETVRKEKKMRKLKALLYLGALAFMVIIAFGLPLNYYYTRIYPLDRDVSVHLNYVTKLTDADAIGREFDLALKGLENYHGNPSWIFPTVYSDFDYIKEKIKAQRDMAYAMKNISKTDYAYQRYIENAIRTAGELEKNIGDAEWWLWFTPQNIILAVVWIVVFIIILAYVPEGY